MDAVHAYPMAVARELHCSSLLSAMCVRHYHREPQTTGHSLILQVQSCTSENDARERRKPTSKGLMPRRASRVHCWLTVLVLAQVHSLAAVVQPLFFFGLATKLPPNVVSFHFGRSSPWRC